MNEDIIRLSRMTGCSEAKAARMYEDCGGDFYSALGRLQSEGFDGKGFTAAPNSEKAPANDNPVNKFLSSYVLINKARLPLIIALLAVVFGFPYVVPIVIIAMICRIRFSFEGPLFDSKGGAYAGSSGGAGGTWGNTRGTWGNTQDSWSNAQGAWGNAQNTQNTWNGTQNTNGAQNVWGGTQTGQGSVKYQMPPKYNYENSYSYAGGNEQDRMNREFGEEKGFF